MPGVAPPDHIPESGSGSSRKTGHLLGACDTRSETRAYWPFDVCEALLLLGTDGVKDSQVLHAAYNDAQGLTAELNLNLLQVLNREFGADFEQCRFEPPALFNAEASQMEMYLVSRKRQSVPVGALGETLQFDQGDRILTEISRRFTPLNLETRLSAAGFEIENHFEPDDGCFPLLLARPVGQATIGGP